MAAQRDAASTECIVRPVYLADDGTFPNSRLPLLVYAAVLDPASSDPAATFEQRFQANGWPGAWRNGIFGFHHYHSTAHEVLGICRGRARIQFGGASGPVLDVSAGDVGVIPAGVAHKNMGAGAVFLVVGAYPEGQPWDMKYGRPGERPRSDENIRSTALPPADPVSGADGPLMQLWT